MKRLFVLVVFISLVFPGLGLAQEVSSPEGVQSNLNLIWIVFSSALVLLIQPGFALLAAGLAREKNVINLFIKSLLGMAIALYSHHYLLSRHVRTGKALGIPGWFSHHGRVPLPSFW